MRIDIDRKREGPVQFPYTGSTLTSRDLTDASKEISAVLDTCADLEGTFVLEVSTPGLDRPLVSEQDYIDFSGHPVDVVLASPLDGKRRFHGVLEGLEGSAPGAVIRVREGTVAVPIPIGQVDSCNIRVEMSGFGTHSESSAGAVSSIGGPGRKGRARNRKRNR